MKHLLIQTQLSNYDTHGNFILEADSGWQMVMGRVREMLKLNPELDIDVTGPRLKKLITVPWDVNKDLFENHHLHYISIPIEANALQTRYDFPFNEYVTALSRYSNTEHKYDAVYVNDPMHLRNLRAFFYISQRYMPKFFVHSHFIDNPSCPKFPTETSLWLGQVEASIKADYNFWQCQSALNIFRTEMSHLYIPSVVDKVLKKSAAWDDGYSQAEMHVCDLGNVRFDLDLFSQWKSESKVIIFVPNRIGGRGRSSDYTNCGKFMFDILPKLRSRRQDFVVIAGNPSQKFTNKELENECGPNGYVNLVPDSLRRDEYKVVASNADIVVGLYDQDSYGGTASRECIELGCVPLWIDNYEYKRLAALANWPYVAQADFGDIVFMADALIETVKSGKHKGWLKTLQRTVHRACSYESTTSFAMQKMGLL